MFNAEVQFLLCNDERYETFNQFAIVAIKYFGIDSELASDSNHLRLLNTLLMTFIIQSRRFAKTYFSEHCFGFPVSS